MRLLQYSESGELSIHSFDDGDTPPYAILSHTWGADGDEVTFADLQTGGGKTKPGYEKIVFCGRQARRDSLQYFWIDTCCINKSDKAELACAIRSMFRWYRNTVRCYVYLSDVSKRKRKAYDRATEISWEPAFRSSRWFTRGWTLQELLAPATVQFFSREGESLGSKISLQAIIREITSIPSEVLNGAPLSRSSVNERLRWAEGRVTRRDEDRAYCLQGILNVELAPVYGEGEAGAFDRLKREMYKLEQCIQDIHQTDPRDDKKRIEETKGGLLADSYRWILDNTAFKQWNEDKHSRLLWVKGDPGKGKTMLLCGIINELQSSLPQNTLLSYFFCQATDSRINSATAVLRGLLYMLVHQHPSLVSHVRKKHDHAGKSLFEDVNAWVALTEIFADVLRDPNLSTTYLIIDALDECITDRPKLLEFIARQSTSQCAKWIVSSRNWPDIEAQLENAEQKVKLSLELNAESVAAAVDIFIQQKVAQLAQEKQYKTEMRHTVLQHLTSNANDTFLWVAIVCQDLRAIANRHVLKKLALFPPGLDPLYRRMLHRISESDDAEICQQVLASAAIFYRPVTIPELTALVERLEDFVDDPESAREIISLCGSFLTLQEDTVYFVHQSAKDFLFAKAYNNIFPAETKEVHQMIFSRSLVILSRTLQRDMYSLQTPGFYIKDVQRPDPDPLSALRYPCIYWIDHLHDSNDVHNLQVTGIANQFLKEKYLYWLEGLSLCDNVEKGVVSIEKLWSLVQMSDQKSLTQLVQDARRFIMYHKEAIKSYPLQTYASALLFSPTGSLIRQLFQHEEPKGITIKPAMSDNWGACLQTLEGHSDWVTSVGFSLNSSQLASASHDNTIRIWDPSSGACLQTLEGHSDWVTSVAFSHNSSQLASTSHDNTVRIWDPSSGACLQTLEGHNDWVTSVAFSYNSRQLASGSRDNTIRIWDPSSGACLQTLEGHNSSITSVTFFHNSSQLASASYDKTIKIWDPSSGACLQTLKGHNDWVTSVAFSYNSSQLASASHDKTIRIWDSSSGACLQMLKGHNDWVTSVAFFYDSNHLASASHDKTIRIWDPSSGACLQTLESHSSSITSVAFFPNSSQLASGSRDNTIRIWDLSSGACLQMLEGHNSSVTLVAFSHDSSQLASASHDKTIKIWDSSSGACLQTLEGHRGSVILVAFSPNSSQLASASHDKTIKIWDPSSGACLQDLNFGKVLRHLSFNSIGSSLHTEIGTIVIQSSEVSNMRDTMKPEPSMHVGIGLSPERVWIKYTGNNMLWVPSEYRPSCSSVCGSMIGIGARSGRVWTCRIDC